MQQKRVWYNKKFCVYLALLIFSTSAQMREEIFRKWVFRLDMRFEWGLFNRNTNFDWKLFWCDWGEVKCWFCKKGSVNFYAWNVEQMSRPRKRIFLLLKLHKKFTLNFSLEPTTTKIPPHKIMKIPSPLKVLRFLFLLIKDLLHISTCSFNLCPRKNPF